LFLFCSKQEVFHILATKKINGQQILGPEKHSNSLHGYTREKKIKKEKETMPDIESE
jgi:hypothetical protein